MRTQKEKLHSTQQVAWADLSNFGLSHTETQQKLSTNMGRPSNSLDLDSNQLPSDNYHPSYQSPPDEGLGLTGFFRPKDAPPKGPTNEELCISRVLASPNLILTVEELKKVQSLVAIDDNSRITLDSCRFTFFYVPDPNYLSLTNLSSHEQPIFECYLAPFQQINLNRIQFHSALFKYPPNIQSLWDHQ